MNVLKKKKKKRKKENFYIELFITLILSNHYDLILIKSLISLLKINFDGNNFLIN